MCRLVHFHSAAVCVYGPPTPSGGLHVHLLCDLSTHKAPRSPPSPLPTHPPPMSIARVFDERAHGLIVVGCVVGMGLGVVWCMAVGKIISRVESASRLRGFCPLLFVVGEAVCVVVSWTLLRFCATITRRRTGQYST